MDRLLFIHKTLEKIWVAGTLHDVSNNAKNPQSLDVEGIESARYLFRDFLKQIINHEIKFELPSKVTMEKIIEVYDKSNFDWVDSKKFYEFKDWIIKEWQKI